MISARASASRSSRPPPLRCGCSGQCGAAGWPAAGHDRAITRFRQFAGRHCGKQPIGEGGIALHEADIPADFVTVTLSSKRTRHDEDFRAINPKGQVPALLLDDGNLLTEGAAVLQHIADMAPASRLAPPNDTLDRRRLQGWLNLVGAEIHSAGFVAFMHPASADGAKAFARLRIETKFDQLQGHLDGRDWLMADFSVADAYLVTALGWCEFCGIDLARWPALAAFRDRARARPAVARALSEELALRAAA